MSSLISPPERDAQEEYYQAVSTAHESIILTLLARLARCSKTHETCYCCAAAGQPEQPPCLSQGCWRPGQGLVCYISRHQGRCHLPGAPAGEFAATTARLAVAQHSPLQAMMPQVGIQELHSKLDTSTCANCFTAVGEHTLAAAAKQQQPTGQCCTEAPAVLLFARRDGGAGLWRSHLLPDQQRVRCNRGGRPAGDTGQGGQGEGGRDTR